MRAGLVAAGTLVHRHLRQESTPELSVTEHEVSMKENRTVAKFFAGLLIVSAFTVGGFAPAQARDTGWDLKAPTSSTTGHTLTRVAASDTGWD